MATIFTKIAAGDIPARILHEDELSFSFLDVRPLSPGHALVVPRVEVDQWTDLDVDLVQHLMAVAHKIGVAQKEVFAAERIGLIIAGFEVPHAHVHVFPAGSMAQFDFGQANTNPNDDELDRHLAALKEKI